VQLTDPLVLIPHLMSDARVFWPQIVRFSQRMPVHLSPLDGDSVEAMAEAALATAPPRMALCGLGLGGVVALEMLRRAPERITRIALISTDPLAEPPASAAARESRRVAARANRLDTAIAQEFPPGALAPGPTRAEITGLLQDMARSFGADAYLRQARALQRRPDQQKTLRRAMLPTLVLCGVHDTIVPVRRQEFAAELMPRADFIALPHAGYLPPLEDPAGTTGALVAWLARPSG